MKKKFPRRDYSNYTYTINDYSILTHESLLLCCIQERRALREVLCKKIFYTLDELKNQEFVCGIWNNQYLELKLMAAYEDKDIFLKFDENGNITHISLLPIDLFQLS